MIGPCWVAFATRGKGIKTVNGSYMKLKPYTCPFTWECVDHFGKTVFLQETARLTEQGLITDANPLGIDQILEWLDKHCSHPEKQLILKHIASLPPLGVVIPSHILKLIDKHVSVPENIEEKTDKGEKVSEGLPNVLPTQFRLEGKRVYYCIDGQKHQMKQIKIIANGLKDLCVALDENGAPTIKKKTDTPKDTILWDTGHDMALIEFCEPVNGKVAMILDIDKEAKPMIDAIVRRLGGGTKGKDYDMYGGFNYG